MPYALRIDASSRHQSSHSRKLADRLEARIIESCAGLTVRRRDLAAEPIPHILDKTIAGFYTPPSQMTETLREATAFSDTLIAELKGADTLIVSTHMYNFTVPSALKAWIDQIVRVNETFSFDGEAFTGLVPVRRAYLACAYGAAGYGEGGAFASMNFLEPYLVSLLRFLGIKEVRAFRVEGTTADETTIAEAHEMAERQLDAAFRAAA
ncbi:FMN-dependent NADH-azoreductase [Parvularcula maris]|uniref:FMN dependent NADH:quinone oxidoreductase n=1 Tax=Parvularcula maris TaxID=2965077 RepID=A0A9X2LBG7_9PROT|nr:NAD(P)H-dependent oxidoreductase [Parvularcula maris]MCQ8186636.1 NAD(P)H-dependent oxidoreductase [Parvularcula maris]